MKNNEQLSIRIHGNNPDHHLWLNNGTWYIHFTLHTADFTKQRVRASLKTQDVKQARIKRDRILARYETAQPFNDEPTKSTPTINRKVAGYPSFAS